MAIEAFSAAGERLGRLPPAERDALAGLIAGAGTSLPGRVTAVLPRPRGLGGGRVHISVAAG
ncbi:hypothetical protein CKO45_13590 [Paracraurococcus ruber]|uniref:Uncharacterized protein n=1 Tax=Paracraurococcus ruber TaxID=77675 RepID=A0ABS1D023_9PROT|nr:hypothetical protein [Paracraurococcus ruber]